MNKIETLVVLHEIYDACKESVILNCVSIDPIDLAQESSESYQIKMVGDLDRANIDSLKPILDRHKLALKEETGCVIVRSP